MDDEIQSTPTGPNSSGNDVSESMSLATYTERAYLDYSMYVINDRALPHIADGLKPVCLLYTSPSPRDRTRSRMPSSA